MGIKYIHFFIIKISLFLSIHSIISCCKKKKKNDSNSCIKTPKNTKRKLDKNISILDINSNIRLINNTNIKKKKLSGKDIVKDFYSKKSKEDKNIIIGSKINKIENQSLFLKKNNKNIKIKVDENMKIISINRKLTQVTNTLINKKKLINEHFISDSYIYKIPNINIDELNVSLYSDKIDISTKQYLLAAVKDFLDHSYLIYSNNKNLKLHSKKKIDAGFFYNTNLSFIKIIYSGNIQFIQKIFYGFNNMLILDISTDNNKKDKHGIKNYKILKNKNHKTIENNEKFLKNLSKNKEAKIFITSYDDLNTITEDKQLNNQIKYIVKKKYKHLINK